VAVSTFPKTRRALAESGFRGPEPIGALIDQAVADLIARRGALDLIHESNVATFLYEGTEAACRLLAGVVDVAELVAEPVDDATDAEVAELVAELFVAEEVPATSPVGRARFGR
jgi:hypothetical protein